MVKLGIGKVIRSLLVIIEVEPGGVPVYNVREVWPFRGTILWGPHRNSFCFADIFDKSSGRAINRKVFPLKKEVWIVNVSIIK